MAQPSVRAFTAVDVATPTPSVAKPTGTVQGDILIAFQTDITSTAAQMTTPSGGETWQLLNTRSDTGLVTKTWWKVAGASEPTTYGFVFSGSVFDATVTILAVQSGSSSTPTVANDSSGEGTTLDTPGLTPPDAVSLEIRYGAGALSESSATWTPPTNYTEVSDLGDFYTGSASAARQLPSGAATGTLAFTVTSSFGLSVRHGVTVAIGEGSIPATIDATTVDATADIPTPTVTTTHNETPAPAVVTATAAIPTPTVAASDSTVTTTVVTASASIDTPTVTAVRHDTASPAVVDATADIATPTLILPVLPGEYITGDYQIEWAGQLYGGFGNVYQIIAGSVEGWDDLPGMDSDSALKPSRHGAWPGRSLAQQREVSAIIAVDDPTTFIVSLRALRRNTAVADDDSEQTLVIRTRGEALLAYGAISARSIPSDQYHNGWAQVSLRWVCADPRRFDLTQQSVVVAADGFESLLNDGDTATSPRFRVQGPAVNPTLINETTDRVLGFNITLTSGQLLEIDTQLGTVKIGDVSHMSTLSSESVPVEDFVLTPGSNDLSYEADSGGTAGAETIWRSAHL